MFNIDEAAAPPDALVAALRATPTAEADERCLAALVRLVALNVISSGRLAMRDDGTRWTKDNVDEFVNELYASGRVQRAVLYATSDEHLRNILHKACPQLAADLARKSARGALARRVKRVLAKLEVEEVNSGSYSTCGPGQDYSGQQGPLVRAAFGVHVDVLPQIEGGKTTSFASAGHLGAVLLAILDAAAAPVPLAVLVSVVAQRVGEPTRMTFETLDDQLETTTVIDTDADPSEAVTLDDARRRWTQSLDGEELLVARSLGLTDAELAQKLDRGPTYANSLKKRVAKKAIEIGREQAEQMLRIGPLETP